MKIKGQILVEFILVSMVLLITTFGFFTIYKKFWKSKYDKLSIPSSIFAGAVKTSKYSVSYVR